MHAAIARLALIPATALALACLPHAAVADVVTGTVTPQGAKVVIVDASGATVGRTQVRAVPAAAAGRQVQGELRGPEGARAGLPEPLGARHRQHRLRLVTGRDGRPTSRATGPESPPAGSRSAGWRANARFAADIVNYAGGAAADRRRHGRRPVRDELPQGARDRDRHREQPAVAAQPARGIGDQPALGDVPRTGRPVAAERGEQDGDRRRRRPAARPATRAARGAADAQLPRALRARAAAAVRRHAAGPDRRRTGAAAQHRPAGHLPPARADALVTAGRPGGATRRFSRSR